MEVRLYKRTVVYDVFVIKVTIDKVSCTRHDRKRCIALSKHNLMHTFNQMAGQLHLQFIAQQLFASAQRTLPDHLCKSSAKASS